MNIHLPVLSQHITMKVIHLFIYYDRSRVISICGPPVTSACIIYDCHQAEWLVRFLRSGQCINFCFITLEG